MENLRNSIKKMAAMFGNETLEITSTLNLTKVLMGNRMSTMFEYNPSSILGVVLFFSYPHSQTNKNILNTIFRYQSHSKQNREL